MKLGKIISKNFKLLLRAKGSAFVIILGPLLIILLVGLAFNNSATYDISVGIYAPDQTDLTQSFINVLENENYMIKHYDTNKTCIEAIKLGSIHTCIVFPPDFVIKNNATTTIHFYVDYTRLNLARVVIDSISANVDFRTTELSFNMTEGVLDLLANTQLGIQSNMQTVDEIKSAVDEISSDADTIKTSVNAINLDVDVPSTASMEDKMSEIITRAKRIKNNAQAVADAGYDLVDDLGNTSATLDFLDDLDDLNASANYNFTKREKELDKIISAVSEGLDDVESKVTAADTAKTRIKTSIDSLRSSLTGLKQDLDGLKAAQQRLASDINSLHISSAETIVSPVTTQINPVVPENTKLSYLLPDLFVLIIMFIGILLASTLIVLEKNSKAFFRNFTTPTSPQYFMLTTFLTSFYIILLQIVVILAIVFYFLKGSLLDNFLLTFVILCLVTSFFVLLGMVIGYTFFSQEAAMIASIVVGSVFLFLSNLVLPLESMADSVQNIAQYNPFVVSSNLLRQSLIFDATFNTVGMRLIILLGVILVLYVIIALVQRFSNMRFFKRLPHIQGKAQIGPFALHKMEIKSFEDLVGALKLMSDNDFKTEVLGNKRLFTIGLKIVIPESGARHRIKHKITRKRMLKALEEYKKKRKK
ncbi:MAG: ABC transporter permease [archaeon]